MAKLQGDFRKFMNKNYLGSWDIPDGDDLIATIDHVEREQVENAKGKELKLTIHFTDRGLKPMILNSTNSQRISKVAGTTRVEVGWNYYCNLHRKSASVWKHFRRTTHQRLCA